MLTKKGAGTRKKRATLPRLGLAFVLALAPASLAAAPAKPPAPRNLVLITLDTTRADHLGAWGWPHARTPNLDALAARGTRFARCDTAAPITLPSHATILSGLYPPRHGVRDNGTFVLSPKIETVTERLAARGYDTAAVVSAVVLARRHGLDQGFRLYDDDLEAGYAAGTEVAERTAEETTAAALAAAGKLRAPFFLWVHYFDPHDEYRPPSRFADRATGPHRLYDGEIAYMDEQIGKLLAGLPKDITVAVVGDHGEMLGEHGEEQHGLLLHRGARRVPLLLAGPGVPSGKTSDCLVRTADLAPTLLALAGAPVPQGLDGRGLLPLPTRCDRTSYSESFLPFFAYKWYPPRALSTNRALYIRWPKGALYDLATDPEEDTDLAPRQAQAAKAWDQRLTGLLGKMGEKPEPTVRPASPLSEEERKALESLGYAGGGPGGTVAPSLPDPRAMLEVAVDLHRASEAVQQGKCSAALPELLGVVRRDPHNVPALSMAGFCLEQAGRLDSALNAYRLASRERPEDASPAASAGIVLLRLGRKDEAEKELRRALGLDPSHSDAAAGLAQLLRQRGRRDEAVAVLDAAVAAGSRTPGVYLERALVRAESGRVADALGDFREAARRAPTDPVPLEGAARAAYQLGRQREAAQLYEQLLRLQPGRLDLWKTAGAIYYYELQDHPAALRCFRRALSLEPDPAERGKLEELIRELQG
ncbi:MAG TPA: sulfatase-like hydrolase/transferase [Thermoanaerobaculia bacterium]|nr:sulfatase-like hydrolase/transferase [Thermoanaerobaculia bacterium]